MNFKKIIKSSTTPILMLLMSCLTIFFVFTITNCHQRPKNLLFTQAVYNDIGYYGHAGTMRRDFRVQTDTGKTSLSLQYTLTMDESTPDIGIFRIDDYGKVTWTNAIECTAYKFTVVVDDLNNNLHLESSIVTINVVNLPSLAPINSLPNPTSFDFSQLTTNDLDDFSYSLNNQNHTMVINGFNYNTNQIILESGDLAWKIYPANTYMIQGVQYIVTAIGSRAFASDHMPTSMPSQTNVIVKLNKDLVTINDNAFSQQGSQSVSPSSANIMNKVYIDLSLCENLREEREDNKVLNTGYWFFGGTIMAFIPPIYCESLTWLPDDMFEASYFECDIDLRNFVKLDTLGHWSIGRWNIGGVSDSNGQPNDSLNINGSDGKAYGSVALPDSINKLTWASFASSQINILYWNISAMSKITFDNNSATLPETHWYGDIFSSTYIQTIYMSATSTTTQFSEWQSRIGHDGKSGVANFRYGPYLGTSTIIHDATVRSLGVNDFAQ